MEWTKSIRITIQFIESHILEEINLTDIAKETYISPFYLQKGFKIMSGYTISEYIRYRRLYLAALDAISGEQKIIDLAYKYLYETPESFTKAFTRFHGISPMQIRNHAEKIKTFLPLKIKISIQGGNDMDYVVEKMDGFKVIGIERLISNDTGYQDIPKFWNEFCQTYCYAKNNTSQKDNAIQKVVCDNTVGEFGICIDDNEKEGTFRYMIAGMYQGGEIPEGMSVFTIPDLCWAKFRCKGALPGSLQSINTKVFKEWLPNNPEFEISNGIHIEWYSKGDTSAFDYESAVWIPVVKK